MAKPISPVIPGQPEIVWAKNQPPYIPLPSYRYSDGVVVSRWGFSWREIFQIIWTRSIYVHQMTFNQALQPIKVTSSPPLPEQPTLSTPPIDVIGRHLTAEAQKASATLEEA